MPETDIHLFQQIKADNRTAFDKLFHLHYERLVHQAYKITQKQADAEDIVQAIFIDFWIKRNQLNIEKSIIGYLNRMVHNRCLDYFRKQKSITTQKDKYF